MDVSKLYPWRSRGFVLTLTMLTATGCAGKPQGRVPGVVVVDIMQAPAQAGAGEDLRGVRRPRAEQSTTDAGTASATTPATESSQHADIGSQATQAAILHASSEKTPPQPESAPVSPVSREEFPTAGLQPLVVTALEEVAVGFTENAGENADRITPEWAEQPSSQVTPQALFAEPPGP